MLQEDQFEIYRRMLRIRYFEEAAVKLQSQGLIVGSLHTSIGQEGEIVGACYALRTEDYMVGNHRSHGHPIGKGAHMGPLMAELMGRQTGVNHGKGGSMHLSDFSVGSLGETSVVGFGIPVAVGAALAAQQTGSDRVCLCFFGDGAANQGTFHEGLNLASIWKLPVIFVCENNQYSLYTPISSVTSIADIAQRASSYSMPGEVVDGQDVEAVWDRTVAAVSRARNGGGPTLIEAKTYRYMEHSAGAKISREDSYRSEEEIDTWKRRDPLTLFRSRLEEASDVATALTIESAMRQEVDEAIIFAKEGPYPDVNELGTDMYASPLSRNANA